MAGAFNIVAQLQLQAPTNLNSIVGQIQQKLSNINATINLQVASGGTNALQALNSALTSLQANLQNTQSQVATTSSSLNKLGTSYAQAGNAANTASAQIGNGVAQMQAITVATNTANNAMENFGIQAGLAARRYSAFLIAGGAIVTFVNQIRSAVGEALSFQREMVKLGQIGNSTQGDLAGLESTVTRLSTTWGVSSKDLLGVTVQLRQAGLSAMDTKIALEALAKSALAPSFGNLQDTTDGLISSMNQFKISAKDTEKTLGAINAVSTQYAVSSKDIMDAIRRTGAAFKVAGGDINELIAMFSTIRSVTRESAESIGSSLRTIMVRFQRPQVIEDMRALGIELQFTRKEAERMGQLNLTGRFVGPFEAVRRVGTVMNQIPSTDPRYAALAEQLGGYRQIEKVVPLLQEGAKMQSIYNTAVAGSSSVTRSAEQSQNAFLTQLTKVKEEFNALIRVVTESEGFKVFMGMVITLTHNLVQLANVLTPLIPVLGALAAFRIGQGIGQLAGGLFRGFGGQSPRFASGGPVPGTGDSDTVHAMLMPGEFVIRKQAAKTIGYDNLERLNRGASPRMHRYAKGGEIRLKENESIGQLFTRQGRKGAVDPEINFDTAEVPLDRLPDSSIFMRTLSNYLVSYPVEKEAKRIQRANPRLSDKDALDKAKADKALIANKTSNFVSGYTAVANVSNMTLKDRAALAKVQDQSTWNPIDTGIATAVQSITGRPSTTKVSSDQGAKDTIAGYLLEGIISSYTGLAAGGGKSPVDFRKIEGSLATLRPFIDFPGNFVPNNIDTKLTKASPGSIVEKALNAGLFNVNKILIDMEQGRRFRLPGIGETVGKPEYESPRSQQKLAAITSNVLTKGYASGGLVRFAEGNRVLPEEQAIQTFTALGKDKEVIANFTNEQIQQIQSTAKNEDIPFFKQAPKDVQSRLVKSFTAIRAKAAPPKEVQAAVSGLLNIPDSMFMVTTGSIGGAGSQRKTVNFSDQAVGMSQQSRDYLMAKGYNRATGQVNVHVLSNEANKEFSEDFRQPVNDAIHNVFANRFQTGQAIDYRLDNNQISSITGQLFEKYVSGLFRTQSAGSQDKFDFYSRFPDKPGLNRMLFPAGPPAGNLGDAKLTYSPGRVDSMYGKWLNSFYTRYAEGGFVVNKESVTKAMQELQAASGIKVNELVQGFKLSSNLNAKPGEESRTRGYFATPSAAYEDRRGKIGVSTSRVKSMEELKTVLAHELGHAADYYMAGGYQFGSKEEGTATNLLGQEMAKVIKKRDVSALGGVYAGEYGAYRYSPVEGFADLFAERLTGRSRTGSGIGKELHEGIGSFIKDVAKKTGGKPAAGFATGGSSTDTIPALLTPGEYVFNREAAQRIGYHNLESMNKTGIPKFAQGGFVHFAEGGDEIYPTEGYGLEPIEPGITPRSNVGRRRGRKFTGTSFEASRGSLHEQLQSSGINDVERQFMRLVTQLEAINVGFNSLEKFLITINKEGMASIGGKTGRTVPGDQPMPGSLLSEPQERERYAQQQLEDFAAIRRQQEADKKRQTREANRMNTDPLAYRASLRESGIDLESEMAARLQPMREARTARRRLGAFEIGDAGLQGRDPMFAGLPTIAEPVPFETQFGKRVAGAATDYAQAWGHKDISKATLNQITIQQLNQAYEEDLSELKKNIVAEKRVNSVLEAERIAREQLNEKYRGIAAVHGVGGTDTGSAIAAQAAEMGGPPLTKQQRLSQWLNNRATSIWANKGKLAATTAGLGALYGGQYFEQAAGSAQTAAETGAGDNYIFNKSIAGGLSGAAQGAAIGTFMGPWGAAIGAGVGGILSLASAAREASREIAKMQAQVAARESGEVLKSGLENEEGLSTRAVGSIQIRRGIRDQRRRYLLGTSGNAVEGFLDMFRSDAEVNQRLNAERNRTMMQTESEIPIEQEQQAITQQARIYARNQVLRGGAVNLRGFRRTNEDIIGGFLTSGSDVQNKERDEIIRRELERGRVAGLTSRTENQATAQARDWETLTKALRSATIGLNELAHASQINEALFSGKIGAHQLGNVGEGLQLFGMPVPPGQRNRFAEAAKAVGAPFGERGAALTDSLKSADRIQTAVIAALPHVNISGLGGSNVGGTVADQLRELVGRRVGGFKGEDARYMDAYTDELKKITSFDKLKSLLEKPDQLVSTVNQRSGVGDLLRQSEALAKMLQQAGQYIIDAAKRFSEQMAQIGETRDKQAQLAGSAVRAEYEHRATFNYSRGTVPLQMSLAQMEYGVNERQARLTGTAGIAETDMWNPRVLGTAQRDYQQRVLGAQQRLEGMRTAAIGERRPEFIAAAKELAELQRIAQGLGQALAHVTDTASRVAAIDEKIAVLRRDESARVQVSERFYSADPRGRADLVRGRMLFENMVGQGLTPNQMSPMAIRSMLSFTQGSQDMIYRGRTVRDTMEEFFAKGNHPALGFANPGVNIPEMRNLAEERLRRVREAPVAQGELAANAQRMAEVQFARMLATGKMDPNTILAANMSELAIQTKALNETMKNAIKAFGGDKPDKKALGGPMFSPHGTDTVAAMLTPGEFVVNREAAQANLALLHRINQARKPIYLAEGGWADIDEEAKARVAKHDPTSVDSMLDVFERESAKSGNVKAALKVIRRGESLIAGQFQEASMASTLAGGAAKVHLGQTQPGMTDQLDWSASRRTEMAMTRRHIEQVGQEIDKRVAQNMAKNQAVRGGAEEISNLPGKGVKGVELPNMMGFFNRLRVGQGYAANEVLGAGRAMGAWAVNEKGDLSGRIIPGTDIVITDTKVLREMQDRIKAGEGGFSRPFLEDLVKQNKAIHGGRRGWDTRRLASGGIVYGDGRIDSTPALLTAGEFVLNSKAAAALGYENLQRFNQGGQVGYYQTGGPVPAAVANTTPSGNNDNTTANAISSSVGQLQQVFTIFQNSVSNLAAVVSRFPSTLAVTGNHNVSVTFTNAEMFSGLSDSIQKLIADQVTDALNRFVGQRFPEVGQMTAVETQSLEPLNA
jgi:hypothetical protein